MWCRLEPNLLCFEQPRGPANGMNALVDSFLSQKVVRSAFERRRRCLVRGERDYARDLILTLTMTARATSIWIG
jgi:hypothetical protein